MKLNLSSFDVTMSQMQLGIYSYKPALVLDKKKVQLYQEYDY